MLAARQLALAGGRSLAGALGSAPPAAAAAAACGACVPAAGFHAARALLSSLQVKIPALGESISDGTVSVVLKQAGDRVEEDEPILQIETDKVTVDVRAPKAGILEAILVKPDDNVEVGHVVASIGPLGAGAAAPAAAAAPQPAAEPQQQAAPPPPPPPKAKAGKPAAAPAAPAAGHRTPSIAFPPRRTPAGEPLSALPRAQAQALLAELVGRAAGAAKRDKAPVPKEYRNMIAVPIVGGSMPVLRGMPVPSGRPGPARRTMSDAEMEAIMLGGADP